jgi:hypothetical protein
MPHVSILIYQDSRILYANLSTAINLVFNLLPTINYCCFIYKIINYRIQQHDIALYGRNNIYSTSVL